VKARPADELRAWCPSKVLSWDRGGTSFVLRRLKINFFDCFVLNKITLYFETTSNPKTK